MAFSRQQPMMIVHQKYPLNAGPPPGLLRERFITPQEHFFVRTHGPIPEVDVKQYRLTVDGMVKHPLEISLDALRNEYPVVTVMATLQCAGSRRNELASVDPIPGEVPWGAEAISNATWRGIPLRSLLQKAGIAVDISTGHVALSGLDKIQKGGERFNFGGSIPLEKALSAEVMLAYDMNGVPLPLIHGFPLRVVVPGYIGARSVKWLSRITIQERPSTNYFQAHAYKLFPPHIRATSANWSMGKMLGEVPLHAVICDPQENEPLHAGATLIRGYAMNGNGYPIERVELSSDGGRTWVQARITDFRQPWAWCFWEVEIQLRPGHHLLVVKAQDVAKQSQPDDIRQIWNFKGYLNHACHKVNIVVR